MADPLDILVVDDEEAICFAFKRRFQAAGHRVRIASTAHDGLEAYRRRRPDLVFLDLRLPDADGLDVLHRLRMEDPNTRVVVITAHGSLDTVRRAVQGKAFDYLVKPLDLDRADDLVHQAAAARAGQPDTPPEPAVETFAEAELLGRSPAIQEVYKRILRVADSDASVLIVGPTGSGKELVARAIHQHSRRKDGPFVAVGGGALPENLIESELFGYAKGAFTGADADKPGHVQAAHGGTLFLDEVGEIPPAVQVKLLRFLDSQTVTPLGSVRPTSVNVRVLAATNRDLRPLCRDGRFREDLYYRLAVVQIEVPPLARRPGDVLLLARHFLARFAPGPDAPALSPEAADLLRAHTWPGNVRELKNAMHHAAVIAGGGLVLPAHLPETVRDPASHADDQSADDPDALLRRYVQLLADAKPDRLASALPELEKALIRRVLSDTRGNQSAAAQRLGIHRNTLRAKIREYGLDA